MSEQKRVVYEFADFRLDAFRRSLERLDGTAVSLKPKALDILFALVERQGQTVSKEQLIKLVWADAHVEEGNLTVHMSNLRKALGDSTDQPKYIVTVSGKGYRFIADVRQLTPDREIEKTQDGSPGEVSPYTALKGPVVIFLGILVVSIIILSVTWFMNRPASGNSAFSDLRMMKLTSSGKATNAAISPDGKYAAYILKEKDSFSVWLRQLSAGSDVQVIPAAADTAYLGLVFSPDGESLYFLGSGKSTPSSLYRTAKLGGAAEKLAEDVDSIPGISPDGKTLAFIRGLPDQKEIALFTLGSEGGEPKKLTGLPAEVGFVLAAHPAWSPDGRRLACVVKKQDENGKYNGLAAIDPLTGKTEEIAAPRFLTISQTAWLPGMNGLLVAGTNEDSRELNQIWNVSYPSGTARRVTNDLNDYRELSLTADGKNIITVHSSLQSNIWLVPNPKTGGVEQITSTNQDGNNGLAWSPNGDLIYASRGSEHLDLWRYGKDGVKQQITSNAGNNFQPAVSPDGKAIALVSDRDGASHIWIMDADGGNARKVTGGLDDGSPDWSPDGRSIIYRSYVKGNPAVFSIPSGGGEPVRLTEKISGRPRFSPDGQKILSTYRLEGLAQQKLSIIPAAGGEPETIFNFTTSLFRWADNGKAILFVNFLADGGRNLWWQTLDPNKPPEAVTGWEDKRIYWFDILPNGKTIAVARGENLNDVVLMSDNSNQK